MREITNLTIREAQPSITTRLEIKIKKTDMTTLLNWMNYWMKKCSIIILIFLCSCNKIKEYEKSRVDRRNNHVIFGDTIAMIEACEIKTYIIDSCEYIGDISNYSQSNYLVHKGNCKFCLVRNKTHCSSQLIN